MGLSRNQSKSCNAMFYKGIELKNNRENSVYVDFCRGACVQIRIETQRNCFFARDVEGSNEKHYVAG